jgi:RNA recognition motif-containing protein
MDQLVMFRSNSPASVSSSGSNGSCDWYPNGKDRQRQVEERRVIYVGRLPDGTSKVELRRRFELFGPIIDISVHFREHG